MSNRGECAWLVVSRPAGLIVNVHVPHQPSIASFVSCLTPEWPWRQSQILEHLHVHVLSGRFGSLVIMHMHTIILELSRN